MMRLEWINLVYQSVQIKIHSDIVEEGYAVMFWLKEEAVSSGFLKGRGFWTLGYRVK